MTGTSLTEGVLSAGQEIAMIVESDRLVAFCDGIESDAISLSWGQRVTISLARVTLRLLG